MNQSTKVEIYLKHISRNGNNVGDKHRKVEGQITDQRTLVEFWRLRAITDL